MCSDTCKHSTGRVCDVMGGSCLNGCDDSFYGIDCNMTCPDTFNKAISRLCDVFNGSCSQECVHGYYGSHCDMMCLNTCNSIANMPSCHSESGTCLAGCLKGFYGQKCSYMCQHCVNHTCQQEDGVCVHGCTEGYSQDVDALKCLNSSTNSNDERAAKSNHFLIPVSTVFGIVSGSVLVIVVLVAVAAFIVNRNKRRHSLKIRRNALRRSEFFEEVQLPVVTNSNFVTCEESGSDIYKTMTGSDEEASVQCPHLCRNVMARAI
ncbi:platelet endothelial aggregation receptor 1-like [Dreissena polymorpha]|uniref:platelet endothelial aggregation receptor 1-like n=1 Tax=Dreissena polymorpha TaxID=45954 RepID=UPI002264BC9A|nr:platelet endothelial aggregation receptor 1-like [Dreissena polymorpha]